MQKNISPVTAIIVVVIAVLVIGLVWWRMQPHQAPANGMPQMNAAQKQGFEAMQKLAPGAGGVPGGAGPTGPAGMRAMQQLYQGGRGPGR
ncbi:MAG: hypothetical protein ACP5VE_01690 [Chthonomonadales bacterium]